MTTLSTHDTKRGEDVRARLAVLAELPDEWADRVRALVGRAQPLPDRAAGPTCSWQTLVGAWPIARERLHAYAEKAIARRPKSHRVDRPGRAFDAAVHGLVDAVLADAALRAELERLRRPDPSSPAGRTRWRQKLLQLTVPGVPDVYQGTELWEHSLVDPDNRRPVDFAARRDCWRRARRRLAAAGRRRTARRSCWSPRGRCGCGGDRPELFTGYRPLPADGRGRRRTRSRSTAAARSRWHPAAASGSRGAAAGVTPCCRCPTATVADVLTGRPSTAAAPRLAELPGALPGGAARPTRPGRIGD